MCHLKNSKYFLFPYSYINTKECLREILYTGLWVKHENKSKLKSENSPFCHGWC